MSFFTIDWLELSLQVTITFGHFLWQACVVAIILFVVQHVGESLRDSQKLRRRRSVNLGETDLRGANMRYTIACLAFFSLPICVVTTFAWVHQSRGPILLAASATTESITIPVVVAPEPTPTVVNTDVSVLPPLEMSANAEIPSIEPLAVPSTAPPALSWNERLQSFAPYLLISYAIGVGFMLSRFVLSIVGSSRLRRTLLPITDFNLLNIIAEQSSRLGLKQIPVVALCQQVSVPVVVGIVKPIILLPPALLCGLDPNQLAAILSHEMAHIRRYDLLVNLLQRIVEAFLFFHPVTWWISRRIRIERENCCDDMAVAGCERIEYVAALLRMAEQCATLRGLKIAPQLESLAADGGSTSQLGDRIRRLLGEEHTPRVYLTKSSIAAIVLAVVVAGLSIVTIAHAGPELQIADPAAENDQNPPEEKSSKTSSSHENSEGGRFTGIVNGPDGKPFAGAEIYLVSNKGDAQKLGAVRAVTDTSGRFDFVAPDMTYAGYDGSPLTHEGLIFAVALGFGPDWMETWGNTTSRFREYWTPRKGAKIELQLAKADVPIRGQFLDADGKPLVGARVRLTELMVPRDRDLTKHLDHWSKASVSAGFLTKVPDYKRELIRTELLPDIRTETRTDADGRFEFSGLGRDRLTRIHVTAPSVLTTTIEVMTRQADSVGTFLDFDGKPTQTVYGSEFSLRLNKGLTVRGIVRDQETKQPIAGMWVTKDYNPLTQPRLTRDVPISDENGRFTISGLNPGILDYEEVRVRRFTAMPQPGVPYLQARAAAVKDEELVIECVRGIPFRLKVVDEAGKPVEAEVEYWTVNPNPLSKDLVLAQMEGTNWPVMNRAARRDDGSYEGFALPGPGAVIIKSSDRHAYRPAFVDPKAFFEPGRINWPDDADNIYGTTDTLVTYGQRVDQNRVHAIELVNPAADSESLELSTTLVPDWPRQVTLVGPDDNPVTGVDSRMRWPDRETKELLSSSTFTLKGLHPKRVKTMIFYAEDQSLAGRLDARGDDNSPIAVRMQPWSTLTGRVLDVHGRPLQGFAYVDDERILTAIDKGGKFRFSRLVPGHTYRLTIRRKDRTLVKTIDHVVLHSGETHDLDDIRIGDANAAASKPPKPDKSVRSGGDNSTESQPTESAKPASQQRARNDQSSWIPARPIKASLSTEGTAKILEDNSVRLEGDVRWQEVSLQFEFEKPTDVEEIRLEILPVDSPAGPQLGRGGNKLMLFDVKPSIEDHAGKFTSLDFASCTWLQNPSDDTTAGCIDHLSDTGWKVPKLPADAASHELVLRFEKPITLRAGQRLTLTIDSGGADELAVLNRIRFAFHQVAVAEPQSVNSTMNGSDVGALVITGGVNEKVEPWEISKLYESAFLRTYLQDHETLPKPIVVPPVRGKVLDPAGHPASGVKTVSHTPRHWVDLDATLALKPHNSGGMRNSKLDGTFGLPERTEPYRVLLVHESGVASVSHEELLRANGIVTLQKWASLSGTLKLGGKPQAGETIVLHFDTLPWSYSRGGPRLTTTHRTTTDKDGNFSFDRVPPLGGVARSLRGHGAVYQCESGKHSHIEMGAGITVTGKLSFPEQMEKNKLKVYARNQLLPIPYPEDWTDEVTEEERRVWRFKWSSTAEGCALEDKNFLLMNSYVPGSISEDGKFTIYGVPERPMVLVVAIPGEAILLERPFDCTGSANDEMNLKTLTVAADHDHHHDHDEVKREDRSANKPQLPRLIVKTVESDGKPVSGTGVLFYDRNSHRAGQKQKFEMVNKRTDESGVADFGVIPNSFGCLQLSPSNKELAGCYTLISTTMTKCTQARPPRANVQTEIRDGILTVTFKMTPHVDLEFNIVDDATDEIVFWSEMFYQDPTTNGWWQFGLVDGSKTQHNFIPISPQITHETIRISALGYETKVFRLPDELDRSKPIRRDVRLKPMPDIELKVLLHDGTPAEQAKLTFHYPNELACLQDHEELSDAQGIVTTKFPPSADIGIFRLEHTGGTAELSMKELLDAVKQNPGEVIHRSISLRE